MSSFEIESLRALPPCHPQLVEAIITQIKSQGLFDDFRKSCLSDIDTKPSYLNLKQRVEGYVTNFLSRQQWSSALQKNQLRETLRKDINESGLLKTGLDHLVDQLIYAHAEKSIRPKVKAEIKQYLDLSDANEQPSAVCVSAYAVAPPHYGPPAMPPLPPVPPPPDVTGAMIETFGNLKPPEPPSPHGSEYSVDMSDSSMVGRDEAPPAIPHRPTVEKLDSNGSLHIGKFPMDTEVRDDVNQDQALIQCSSPEIFEEVSEGGSLGGTPVRDEDAVEVELKMDQARTDFTGLFGDSKSRDGQPISNVPGVIMKEENMAFEILEECVKTEESTRNDGRVTPTVGDEALSSQNGDFEQASVTSIMDEVPVEDDGDDMQISTEDETQCEDEPRSPPRKVPIEDQCPEKPIVSMEDSPPTVPTSEAVENDFHGTSDAELSDTQPPLQIDTEDTEFSVVEKNQCDESQGTDAVPDEFHEYPETSSFAAKKEEPSAVVPEAQDEVVETHRNRPDQSKAERLPSEKSDSERPRVIASNDEGSNSTPDSNAGKGETIRLGDCQMSSSKDSKARERKSSPHGKSTSRSESDRDRHREHRSSTSHSHHTSSSSRPKKLKEHEPSRSRDKDSSDKRSDRKDRERDRKRERDGKDRDRDRAQRDGKYSSSSHSRRKHSRHHQDRRRDEERKTSDTTSSCSHKIDRIRSEDSGSRADAEGSAGDVGAVTRVIESHSGSSLEEPRAKNEILAGDSKSNPRAVDSEVEVSPGTSINPTILDAELPSKLLRKSSLQTSTSSFKNSPLEDINLESEVPLKKRKQRASRQQESSGDQSCVLVENKDVPKESPTAKGRRRSSAASVTSQQSVEALDQPDSPVPSKFGRQRKINPKYEDDGTLSALLFGKN